MPTTIHHKVLDAIQQSKLFQPADCLIVGVSGGADSVALLDLLSTLPGFHLKLVVAHLNHQLRGDDSDGDERFVQELASRYQLPCEQLRVDVKQMAATQRISLEEAGRKARYIFFEELRTKYSATAIAVAHHADDQAETLLMRLLRGAGITGLAAMAPCNQNRVVRPLLMISRQELLDHLTGRKLTFREDKSNADQTYLRNRIRHELIPLLQGYNPAITQRLSATASLLGEDAALLDHFTKTSFNQLSRTGQNWIALALPEFRQQPRPLRMRLLRMAIESILGNQQRYELRHYLLLDRLLIEGSTGTSLNLPRNLVGLLTADYLLFAPKALLRPAPPCNCTINAPGSYELGNGLALTVAYAAAPDSWQFIPTTSCYIDPEQAPFPWQTRPITAGDRLELLGMEGSRSIQDILTDLKFPRHLRSYLPLICQDSRPLWLAGIRRSRHALTGPGLKRTVHITLSGQEQLPLFP